MRVLGKYFLVLTVTFLASCATKRNTPVIYKTIEEKYAHQLGVGKESISNKKLYAFIDEWYGVKYSYGGKSKKGVDCSGFASILYREVFGADIAGPSASLYDQFEKIPKEELKEGDLVFFKIETKEISHVGIYLQNNKFVHATTKAGVMIDDLNNEYYKKYFGGSVRIIDARH
jgi:lipoprotein Spr